MSTANFRVYLDNEPASKEQLELFSEIRVDQAIGMASEAELQMGIGVDDDGAWDVLEDDFAQPFSRVRVEIRIDENDYIPLIDGPIVGQNFELDATPADSNLVLVVHDDSVLLNQDEEVELYEDQSPDQIATNCFQQYGLTAETDSVPSHAGALTRYLMRRGTPMQFLRELARRHGMFVYVEPENTPGNSKGIFKFPQFQSGDYPELLLLGAERNINKFSARFDGLRPLKARAFNVDITNQEVLSSEAVQSSLDAQGDTPVHELMEVPTTLLARTREDTVDLDAATSAAVDHSSWSYSAKAEVSVDNYAGVLMPYRIITVAGAGGHLSGNWLISQVRHNISDVGYSQSVTLRRNARTASAGGDGGLLGGVF